MPAASSRSAMGSTGPSNTRVPRSNLRVTVGGRGLLAGRDNAGLRGGSRSIGQRVVEVTPNRRRPCLESAVNLDPTANCS